jgi:hypothetical protein
MGIKFEVPSDEDESLRCKEKLPLLRLSLFACETSDATAVNARCRESDGEAIDFAGECTVTRAFTADAGVRPKLLRVWAGLNGDGDRGLLAVLAIVLLVLALAMEFEADGLRAMVALLLTLAFGRKLEGVGESDDWDVIWPFEGEAGLETGRDGARELEAAL